MYYAHCIIKIQHLRIIGEPPAAAVLEHLAMHLEAVVAGEFISHPPQTKFSPSSVTCNIVEKDILQTQP
jgi:hypothetical protein